MHYICIYIYIPYTVVKNMVFSKKSDSCYDNLKFKSLEWSVNHKILFHFSVDLIFTQILITHKQLGSLKFNFY